MLGGSNMVVLLLVLVFMEAADTVRRRLRLGHGSVSMGILGVVGMTANRLGL